ncbi:antibiotic biosynthesis monooxygenase [Bacillus sp. ISL-35]|uniref:antibiotic biosynthesis monooxygenase family protein n=1 Tax=Bacillus sp. ISL-35 TaxID=2819122 RepID=UPI001BE6326D|nr:antibiotic biosynthesis monooxygenase [Bacillus sp. ISL-35]MBT2679874.1 antibiotic biosynthesis monooxygenase [Bacillus sp. ISL-35]MBT2704909.1 antibiotic biosynthesis monooxygenase [Chryseobacterium sp. ISL-80]
MFYQMKRLLVKEGHSGQVVERFSKKGMLIEKQPGFLDKQVLVKKSRRGDEEVLVMISWQAEQDWKNWEKHPDHIAGHKAKMVQPKPDYILESSQDVYEVM